MEIVTFDFLEKRMHMTDIQLNILLKTELDVSAPTITVWRKNGIPADRQLEILEKFFSVDPEDIRKLTITNEKPNPNEGFYIYLNDPLFNVLTNHEALTACYIRDHVEPDGMYKIRGTYAAKDLHMHKIAYHRIINIFEKLGLVEKVKSPSGTGNCKWLRWNSEKEKELTSKG